ncbi:protein sprouty 2 [Biomphalaria glabrata]|uniref:Protein sprouty homolog 2-like n=1 Tax=Biomphalaria glabrata TaxID=6526 RepID=A0A9U8EL67_BIOGL|nr:protein sprouty homolog 2-like [Biomphalaria glabrata]XP_013092621.2 protein sprouty homolog 2-like [Biomphalaria glabrata]KAI8757380.1 protein sprouty-like protein 2-like [Biomphalaria glabrata]
MRTSLRTISPPESFSRQLSTPIITLGQVRAGPRTTNEYVDSPRVHASLPLKPHLPTLSVGGNHLTGLPHGITPLTRGTHTLTPSPSPVVSQQPLSKSPPLKKELVIIQDGVRGGETTQVETTGGNIASTGANHGDSIMCESCGKCRCAACTEPRSLPSHWCCRDTCEVSPDNVIDFCTCFCCVKCMFYHCGSEEENQCYENPCGCCSTAHCCQRWTVMGMMALCLPCLWTYWPARACLAASTFCYSHCRRKGCQCNVKHDKTSVLSGGGGTAVNCGGGGIGGNSKHSQTRRLLIESDSSSA